MHSREILALFDLPPNSPIPPDLTVRKVIGGVHVQIIPQRLKGISPFPNRRVLAWCPICDTMVCAGHLHQHVGTKACLKEAARKREALTASLKGE